VDDSPQRMARGIAIGFFTAYLPVFGLHMLIALVLAFLLRANKVLALLTVWISNPFTFLLIYYPSYRLGQMILPFFRERPQVEINQIQNLLHQTFSLDTMLLNVFDPDYWKQVASVFTMIGLETLIGGLILGTVVAGMGYWVAFYFIIGYRTRKQARKSAWKRVQTQEC
jgi:uncharacterized protein (DUF2062 family)